MIIGISGKINAGKDLVGNIIQIITNFPKMSTERVVEMVDKDFSNNVFEIKKFADYLKDIVCILIGCTREQLEDREFKEKELGEEWAMYEWFVRNTDGVVNKGTFEEQDKLVGNYDITRVPLTPRKMLQLLGTEAGRDIIHPNIWVNALFNKYKGKEIESVSSNNVKYISNIVYPNWIITDMRFSNELKVVKDKGGITIRVNREYKYGDLSHIPITVNKVFNGEHPSETALDNAEFDYIIQNDGTIKDLVIKVREILVKENII